MSTAYAQPMPVAAAPASARADFIRRTYFHLAAAIAAFAGLEALLLKSPFAPMFAEFASGRMWLVILGAFMLVSWVADKWARSDTSLGMQYLGLGLFILAEAIIFIPLLYMAQNFGAPDVIQKAALTTGLLVAALTAVVLVTGKDFSFLRTFITIGSVVALGLIALSLLVGFSMGLVFSGAMILLAAASILYTTSNMVHHYRTDQHVAAALGLFSSVALMFWYVLRIFMHRD